MINVTFIQEDGVEKTIAAKLKETLMEEAKANSVNGIIGDCGGGCSCATCHVYVDTQWTDKVGPPTEIEEMALNFAKGRKDNSRLCCQIKARPELDGLRLTVAPC